MTEKKPSFSINTVRSGCDLIPEGFHYKAEASCNGPRCPFCQTLLNIDISIDNDAFTVVMTCVECPRQFVEDYVNADSNTDHRYDD